MRWGKELEALQFFLEGRDLEAEMTSTSGEQLRFIHLYDMGTRIDSILVESPLSFLLAFIRAKEHLDAKAIVQGKPAWKPNPF